MEDAAIWRHDASGQQVLHWIDVGHPAADRIHRASKLADKVTIVCHKSEAGLAREARRRKIHKADEIDVIMLAEEFVDEIVASLSRSSDWTLIRSENDLQMTVGDAGISGSIRELKLPELTG